MKHMLDYLVAHPEEGLLGYQMGLPTIVQYWRSFDHLEAFANDADDPHVAVWRNYWRRVGSQRQDRDLARDVPGRAGEIRGDLREHAAVRAGQGGYGWIPLTEGKTARQRFQRRRGRTR